MDFIKTFQLVNVMPITKDNSHLEYLLSKCDSEFEKETLYEIYKNGLPLPDDAQKIFYDNNRHISKVDFYYQKDNILVFIDGSPHKKDFTTINDAKQRSELSGIGYRIFSIDYLKPHDDLKKLSEALL
jgi:hypothetical protein